MISGRIIKCRTMFRWSFRFTGTGISSRLHDEHLGNSVREMETFTLSLMTWFED
jgi:hypothetical protein